MPADLSEINRRSDPVRCGNNATGKMCSKHENNEEKIGRMMEKTGGSFLDGKIYNKEITLLIIKRITCKHEITTL